MTTCGTSRLKALGSGEGGNQRLVFGAFVADRLLDLSHLLGRLSTQSRDFY